MDKAEIITRRVGCELPTEIADELKILSIRMKIPQSQLISMILQHALKNKPKEKTDTLQLTSPFGN